MDAFVYHVLGENGVILVIALMIFALVFKQSNAIFSWIEERTYANREYVISKLELLNKEFDPVKIIYILLGMSFGSGLFIMMIFSFFGQFFLGVFFGLIAFIIGWKAPRPIMDYLVNKKNIAYQNQMVDGLQLLANGLRAGQSLPQAIGMVVDELPAPLSQEFGNILQQNKIGLPLEECFEELVKRVPIEDNQMFVTSVNILHETGGNLPEVFSTIVEIIRERIRIKQKIDAITAQGKFQGMTLFFMPLIIGMLQYAADPESMSRLFTPIGSIFIVLSLVLDCIGMFFILKIIKIKV